MSLTQYRFTQNTLHALKCHFVSFQANIMLQMDIFDVVIQPEASWRLSFNLPPRSHLYASISLK